MAGDVQPRWTTLRLLGANTVLPESL